MARRPRYEAAGAIHHVYARGVAQRPIYRDDIDRMRYLRLLGRAVRQQGWRCLAYCLMGNHMHLFIETPEPNLGQGMQRFHGDYAQAFNDRYGLSGHVFQGRYASVPTMSDGQIWATTAYVVRNPVKAGLCATPGEWKWSSHRATVHGCGPEWLDSDRLLGFFGAAGGDALERYIEHVEAPAPDTGAGA